MNVKKIVLVGQPNCGKSSIFNVLSDIKTSTSNFTGTTVSAAESLINVNFETIQLIDLPGTYSLNPTQEEERVTLDYIIHNDIDLIINVIDANSLTRSLELTIELLELGLPMIIALNMIDEAESHGIQIDIPPLEKRLKTKVFPTTAIKGKGVKELVDGAANQLNNKQNIIFEHYFTKHIENAIDNIDEKIQIYPFPNISSRFIALKAVEYPAILPADVLEPLKEVTAAFEVETRASHNMDGFESISYERHHLAMKISEETMKFVKRGKRLFSEKIDDYLLHPFFGHIFMLAFFFIYFFAIFVVGSGISHLVEGPLDSLGSLLDPIKQSAPIWWFTLNGAYMGIVGILGIVLPYFLPLIFLTVIFEELGYLSRVAFLVDGLFHKIGLHGKSVVPMILGFGCSVPAIYATRIIDNKRDKEITAMLIPFIPCSARIAVIFALTAAFTGPIWSLIVFAFVLLVIAITGKVMSKYSNQAIGLVLEMPRLKMPGLGIVFKKTWYKIKTFLKEATPFLLIGSVVLGWIEYFNIASYLNTFFAPVLHFVLGLPQELGSTLVFGFFRKELILVMMSQALGVSSFSQIHLATSQIIVFIIFVTLYFPCFTTFVVICKEFSWRVGLRTAILSILLATASAFLFRMLFLLF